MSDLNGATPEPAPHVAPSPLPVSWNFDPVMVGDRKAFLLQTHDPAGSHFTFLDEQHAVMLRDRITECVSGLVLP